MAIRPIIAAAIVVLAAPPWNNDCFVMATAPSAGWWVLGGDGSRAGLKF